MAVSFSEGCEEQLEALVDTYVGLWSVALSADTITYADSTTFADVSIGLINGAPCSDIWSGFSAYNSDSTGCTATFATQHLTYLGGLDTVRFR